MQKNTAKNTTTQKFISSFLIVSMLVPAIFLSFDLKRAEAVIPIGVPVNDFISQTLLGTVAGTTVSDTAISWKNVLKEIRRQFLMLLARKLLNEMTQSTINWINSGFYGNPLFLENPRSFFRDIAKSEIKGFVNTIGYDRLRFPFGRQFSLQTIDSYKRQFETNAQYTLSRVINDPALLERYRNDFRVGGWNGFLLNTQYPQNNYIGFYLFASEELGRRLKGTTQNEAGRVQDKLQQGMGFLSTETCPTNPDYDRNMEGSTCPGGVVVTTPGSVIGSNIMKAINSKYSQNELAAAMGNSLSAIFDALINHFMDEGLSALSNIIDPPADPTIDDFEYFGDTINSENFTPSYDDSGSTDSEDRDSDPDSENPDSDPDSEDPDSESLDERTPQ